MNIQSGLPLWQSAIVYILFFWSIFWKGVATWSAARNNQKNWFMVMLILNTIGILEIAYLFHFAKKRMKLTDIKNGFKQIFYIKTK